MTLLRPALSLTLIFALLTGLAYPLAVTGLAQLLFPDQAHGSLLRRDGRVMGSSLIAQGFADARYLQPRPSAAGTGFDAAASSGSNLGPTSRVLLDGITRRTQALAAQNPGTPVPLELVTASASGLDPHLSPAGAAFQAPRIAAARGLPTAQVLALVQAHTEPRLLGFIGEPRVNVLAFNLALDALWPAASP